MSDLRLQAYRELLHAIELHLRLFGACDEAPEVWLELAADSMRAIIDAPPTAPGSQQTTLYSELTRIPCRNTAPWDELDILAMEQSDTDREA